LGFRAIRTVLKTSEANAFSKVDWWQSCQPFRLFPSTAANHKEKNMCA
jgi:hypothetical protein